MNRFFDRLLLTAFVSGMSVMSIEMAVSRLLAPYFGTSLFVWTNVLGLIMVALSIGYYLGGRLADKYASERLLYQLLLTTGIYLSFVPILVMPITRVTMHGMDHYALGIIVSALAGMVILLSLPFIVLGMVTPYIVRLKSQKAEALGQTAGRVFTWSNVGSIIGTFIPALLTIPWIGTHKTIMLFACLLMLVSIIGMANWKLLVIPMLALLLVNFFGKVKPTPGLIFDKESVYNYIQVIENKGLRMLRLNEGHAEHSLYQKDRYIFHSIWDYFLLPPVINHSQEALFIGVAAGTAVRQYNYFFPSLKIDGVELDPELIEVGKKYFGLNNVTNFNSILKDGRVHVTTTQKKYDTVIIDAFKQPYIPFHLITQEFFTAVKKRLNTQGIVAINVGSTQWETELLLMIQNTLKSVFKYVYIVKVAYSHNYLVWASDTAIDMNQVAISDQELMPTINYIKHNFKEVKYNDDWPVLTDDLAPLELYTEKMILDFVLGLKN